MASKRMFSLSVIDTDAFLEMPCSTQALYFHLCMRADDDGFVGSPKIVTRTVGASEDDLKLLIAKRFVLTFEDGVIVIKHWRMHNTLSVYRYKETAYLEDKALLKIKPNNAYTFGDGEPLDDAKLVEMGARQTANKQKTNNRQAIDEQKTNSRRTVDEQKTNTDKNRIDKNRIEENSIEKNNKGECEGENRKRFVPPTVGEVIAYCVERGNDIDAQQFIDFYASKGWMVGKNKMTDWKAAVRTWEKYHKEKQDAPKNKAAQELDDFYKMGAEWVAKKKGEKICEQE